MVEYKNFFLKYFFCKEMQKYTVGLAFEKDIKDKLSFFYREINCSTIDIIQYSEDVDLIVDDEGLLISDNPVFEIPSELYKRPLYIAGNFLIGKRKVSSYGDIETVGFESLEEVRRLIPNLTIKVIGVTR